MTRRGAAHDDEDGLCVVEAGGGDEYRVKSMALVYDPLASADAPAALSICDHHFPLTRHLRTSYVDRWA